MIKYHCTENAIDEMSIYEFEDLVKRQVYGGSDCENEENEFDLKTYINSIDDYQI